MSAAQGATQHMESIKVIAVLAAVALVVFWRTAIKLTIIAVAAALIALLGFGTYVLLNTHG